LANFLVKDLRVIEILMSMKYTLVPDEYFFQEIVDYFGLPFINDNKRWVNWDNHQKVKKKNGGKKINFL
jgi:hypothetical protein